MGSAFISIRYFFNKINSVRLLLSLFFVFFNCNIIAQDLIDTKIAVNNVIDEKTFVLIFCNENYKYEQPVPYALNDGDIFRQYCEKTLGIAAENIKYQPDASLNDMRIQLSLLEKKVNAFDGEARAIVYYSGHGMPSDDDKTAYLLPIDGNSAIPMSGLSIADLYKQLGEMKSRQTMVFLDACFSGARRDGQMLASSRGVAIKVKDTPVTGNMVVFSAAQGNETAYPYKEKHHGLFTYFVLKQLHQYGGHITLGELSDYVTKQVSRTSIVKNEKSQTPSIIASNSVKDWRNWIFAEKAANQEDVVSNKEVINTIPVKAMNKPPLSKDAFFPNPMNKPGQKYPQVNSEGYARFRIEAPDAKSVIVSLGLGGRGGTTLRKDKDGVWVGTTEGPMDPGFHYYHLTIDGEVVNDPGTNNYFGSCRWESGIEIPAPDQDFYAYRDNISHGKIQEVKFYSNSQGKMQTAMVYLPPTYGQSIKGKKERFPVLYLQHGWGENETSWPVQGKAGLIMDNLIADGKIKPFIIVMAYGLTNDIKFGTIGQFTAKEFETLLVDELVPFIDKNFLTKADKWNRAMAGLSMGGMETKLITLRRPEAFGYWGLLSGGTYMPEDIKDPKAVKYIFEGCGSKENPAGINKSVNSLKAAGYNAEAYISEGTAHEFLTWRRCLEKMAQSLFK
jgi:enterochelin esterase-like enzyme